MAQINPINPQWLCELVHRLQEKEPELRIQTAAEVVGVLESRVVDPERASMGQTYAAGERATCGVPNPAASSSVRFSKRFLVLPTLYSDI
jgi:hypothetical protein